MLAARAEEKSSADDRLARLAWMKGEWVRQQGDDQLEEIWSAPAGDSLMGMFRWSKQGKLWMLELMAITVEGEDVVVRLKHFDRQITGWEEKEAPPAYKLVRQKEGEAVFENAAQTNPRRFIFQGNGTDRYVVRLESVKGEETSAMEFVFAKRD